MEKGDQSDKKTEIGRIPALFKEEESEDRETKKSGNFQDESSGPETRKSRSVLQKGRMTAPSAEESARLK